MFKGWSPYSEQTTNETLALAYPESEREGKERVPFLYPLYSMLILAPFALIDDPVLARAIWMTLLEGALLGLIWASISLSRWQPSFWMTILVFILALFWFPSVRPVLNGNISVLCAFFVVLALLAIRSDHDALAGFLLAFASIRPELVLLPVVFIMIWAASQGRWVLFWSPLMFLGLLTGISSLFIPDWLWQNLQQVAGYLRETFRITPGNLIAYWLPGIGLQLGRAFTMVGTGVLIWEWWQAAGKDFRWFLWAFYVTQAVTHLIGLDTSLDFYVGLFPALVLVLSVWDERWGSLGRLLIGFSIFLLFFGLWGLALSGESRAVPTNLDPLLLLLLPLSLAGGLYWVRWWAIRPPKLYIEILSKHI